MLINGVKLLVGAFFMKTDRLGRPGSDDGIDIVFGIQGVLTW